MAFTLPPLPYGIGDLAPHMTEETLQFHHGKHHATYVNNLNNLVKGTQFEGKSLEDIIVGAHGVNQAIFNNAAQHFNHSFFWKSLKPGGGGVPQGAIARAIERDFGGYTQFRQKFIQAATTHFGSGWAFLVSKADGKLDVESHHDASTPFLNKTTPLLCLDVWEHAYYIQYRNNRAGFVNTFFDSLANWDFANQNYADVQAKL